MRRASLLLVGLVRPSALPCSARCSGSSDDQAPTPAPPPRPVPTTPVALSLLVFNVEYGGSKSTDAVLADLDADVVGVLESYNRLPEIAKEAGYPYYDVGLQILSKYPILEPSGADGLYACIEVRPGEAVAMINTHLDYVQDGPTGWTAGCPSTTSWPPRRRSGSPRSTSCSPRPTACSTTGWPVLFTGDLNEPSHLDWTAETAARHGGLGPVAWPVSEALVGAGPARLLPAGPPGPGRPHPGNTWGGVAGSKGARGASTTPTWADRSRWSAARWSASAVATASTAATRSGPPTIAPCSRS